MTTVPYLLAFQISNRRQKWQNRRQKTGGICLHCRMGPNKTQTMQRRVQQLGKFKGFKGSSKLLGKFKTYKERSRNTTHKGMQEVLKLCTVN